MKEENNKIGRPKKYKNVKELEQLIEEYFEICNVFGRPYTITGLARHLDMTRQDLLRYQNDYGPDFSDTIKKAKTRVEEFVEESLFRKGITAGVIFNLTNNFGWKNEQQFNHSGSIKLEDLI